MRLIDADKLWDEIITEIEDCGNILDIVEKQPVVAPGRVKGTWIKNQQDFAGQTWNYSFCSICGAVRPVNILADPNCEFNFCPTCGASMGGEDA